MRRKRRPVASTKFQFPGKRDHFDAATSRESGVMPDSAGFPQNFGPKAGENGIFLRVLSVWGLDVISVDGPSPHRSGGELRNPWEKLESSMNFGVLSGVGWVPG